MIFKEVEEIETAIDNAINNAMETVVTEHAKDAIVESEESNVYSYDPIFLNRRMESGGLKDRSTMRDSYDIGSKTLTITMETDWQNIGFRYIDGRGAYDDLADAIENNNIYNAPPRPFMQQAEDDYAKNQFESDIMDALTSAGL